MAVYLNALAGTEHINTYVELANDTLQKTLEEGGATEANKAVNLVNPEVFYTKQLLDTIRMDAKEYKYYHLADEAPIQGKADKLLLRRWTPLRAHIVPLEEGVPPKSDKGSVKTYTLEAKQYGRYMEFTDHVDFRVVDPVIAHYTREYSIVAMETLDLLAREALFSQAQKQFANGVEDFEQLTIPTVNDAGEVIGSKPNITDLRLIVLQMKRALAKPRGNGKFHVLCSPEFTYDMIDDPTVKAYMTINQTTRDMYDGSVLFPLFGLDFEETLVCPSHGDFFVTPEGETNAVKAKRVYAVNPAYDGTDADVPAYLYGTILATDTYENEDEEAVEFMQKVSGYVKADLTGKDESFIPDREVWDIDKYTDALGAVEAGDWKELNVHHILIVGKNALTRTGLQGEGAAKVYAKPKGSAGVLDPIDQRQSIGFKINSVGFGVVDNRAVVDYMCIPTTANMN